MCTVRSRTHDEAGSSYVPTLVVRVLVVCETYVTNDRFFAKRLCNPDCGLLGSHLSSGVIPMSPQYDRVHRPRRLLPDTG